MMTNSHGLRLSQKLGKWHKYTLIECADYTTAFFVIYEISASEIYFVGTFVDPEHRKHSLAKKMWDRGIAQADFYGMNIWIFHSRFVQRALNRAFTTDEMAIYQHYRFEMHPSGALIRLCAAQRVSARAGIPVLPRCAETFLSASPCVVFAKSFPHDIAENFWPGCTSVQYPLYTSLT